MPPSPISYPNKKKMKPIYSLALVASFLVFANISQATNRLGGLMGGWKPIKDMSDPHVLEIGQFAVSEHNKVSNSKLGFSRVIKGETQVVNGVNYRLVIEAKDGEKVGSYEAIVWEKPMEKFRKLTSFKPVKN